MHVLFIIILMILSILNISVYTGILGIILILSYFTQDNMILFCSSLVIIGFVNKTEKKEKKEGFIDIAYIKSFFTSADTSLNALNTDITEVSGNIIAHSQHLGAPNWWHDRGSNNKFCGDTTVADNWNNNVDTDAYKESPSGEWQCEWPEEGGSADPPITCNSTSGLWQASGCCSNPTGGPNWHDDVQNHLLRISTTTTTLAPDSNCIYGGTTEITCGVDDKWTMNKTCCPDPAGNEANWNASPNSDAYGDLSGVRKTTHEVGATCKYGGGVPDTSCTAAGWTASGCCPNPGSSASYTDSGASGPWTYMAIAGQTDPNDVRCRYYFGGTATQPGMACVNERWDASGCCPDPVSEANWDNSPVNHVDMNLNSNPNLITCKVGGGSPTDISCNDGKWSATGCCPVNPDDDDIEVESGGVSDTDPSASAPNKGSVWSNNKANYNIANGALTCVHAWGPANAYGTDAKAATCDAATNKWTVRGCPGQPTANTCYTRWGPKLISDGVGAEVQNPNVILFKKNFSYHKGSGWTSWGNLLISAITDTQTVWRGMNKWKERVMDTEERQRNQAWMEEEDSVFRRNTCNKSSVYGGGQSDKTPTTSTSTCSSTPGGTPGIYSDPDRCNNQGWCQWAPMTTTTNAEPIFGWRGMASDYRIGRDGDDGMWGGTEFCPNDWEQKKATNPNPTLKNDIYHYNGKANASHAHGAFGNSNENGSHWKPNIALKQCYHDLPSNEGVDADNTFHFCPVPSTGGDVDGLQAINNAGLNAVMLGTIPEPAVYTN